MNSDDLLKRSIEQSKQIMSKMDVDSIEESGDAFIASLKEINEIEDTPPPLDKPKNQAPPKKTSPQAEKTQPPQTKDIPPVEYKIWDVSYAIEKSLHTGVMVSLPGVLGSYLLFNMLNNTNQLHFSSSTWYIGIALFVIIFTKGAYATWSAHHPALVIHLSEKATMSFCASDMENSLLDIITFKPFRNNWKRKTIDLRQIIRIDNETFSVGEKKQRTRRYSINISGEFGSQKVVFSNKQKRDECRALLGDALKTIKNSRAKLDSNYSLGDTSENGT